MPDIKRIVIFGDSLSDIGNMQARNLVGRMSGVNAHGRFSDGKNWVDFFWEGIGGSTMYSSLNPAISRDKSKAHRSMLENIAFNAMDLQLVNYAEGGAIGLHSDEGVSWGKTPTYQALASLDQQVQKYLSEIKSVPNLSNDTLHIVWIGANDIATIDREYEAMPALTANIRSQISLIIDHVWKSHFLVIDLPSLVDMPRFKVFSAEMLERLERRNEAFNRLLDAELAGLPKVKGWKLGSLQYLRISTMMSKTELGRWGFAPFAKPWSSPVDVGIGGDLAMQIPFAKFRDIALDESSRFATTEDELHPTEGVYQRIAQLVNDALTGAGFKFV